VRRCHSGQDVPGERKALDLKTEDFGLDTSLETGRSELLKKEPRIRQRARAHAGDRRRAREPPAVCWNRTMSHSSGAAHTATPGARSDAERERFGVTPIRDRAHTSS
jgi:hypothetical protein